MGLSCIRIEVPNDIKLSKHRYDSYSTTEDRRLIKDLKPCAMVYRNKKWIVMNELLKYPIHEWWQYE